MTRRPITKEIKAASFASLFKESDLGAVIIAGVLLESSLEKVLQIATVADKKGKIPKNYFLKPRFGDFHAKITSAYKAGLIGWELHDALHIVRKLRNEAAHCNFEFNLEDRGVTGHLNKLKHIDAKADEERILVFESWLQGERTDKVVFVVRCHIILTEIHDCLHKQISRLP